MRTVLAALAVVCLALSGCGGGGDSGGAGGGGGGGGGGTTGSLTLSSSTLTFSANNLLVSPPSQTVSATVTGITSGTLYIRIVVTGTAVNTVSDVTITGNNSGQAVIVPQLPQALGPGTHTSVITVTACTSGLDCTSSIIGTPQTVNVTYTVDVTQAQPGLLSYIINPGSPDADFSKTVQISANPNWTISSAFTGLTVTPASGTAATGNVTVTLSRAIADSLPTGISTAQLVLTNGRGTQASIPVTMDIRRPEIVYASPHTEPSGGLGTTTILRGAGFDAVSGFIGANFVSAGGASTPGTNLQVHSAKEMRVQRPALSAGTYSLQVLTAAGANAAKPSAKIVVVDPLAAPAGVVAFPADARTRRVTDLIWDAERSALVAAVQYSADEATAQIVRYTYSPGTGWSAPAARSQPYLWSLALLPDATGWMATALINSQADNAIVQCVPDFSSCENHAVAPLGSVRRTAIGMTNDGEPIVLTIPLPPGGAGNTQRYSIQRDSVSSPTAPAITTGFVTASEDGSAVLIGDRGNVNGAPKPLQVFRSAGAAGAGFFTAITEDVPFPDRLAIDGRGVKAVVNGTLVYDTLVMAHIGMLPATTRAAVLNRDGSRAYTWDQNGTVRTFNLNNLPATKNTEFPEVLPAITPAGSPGAGPAPEIHLVLTPDGRTLFMAGTSQIVVVPLP